MHKKNQKIPEKYNLRAQECCGAKIKLILYDEAHFAYLKAKRFLFLTPDGKRSGQNFWIPNTYLLPDGSVNPQKDLTWLFAKPDLRHKLELAGYQ